MDLMKSAPLRPTFSRSESRHEASDRAARDIIAQDAAVRNRNTERLRAARLARDAAEPAPAAVAPPPKRRKKAVAS